MKIPARQETTKIVLPDLSGRFWFLPGLFDLNAASSLPKQLEPVTENSQVPFYLLFGRHMHIYAYRKVGGENESFKTKKVGTKLEGGVSKSCFFKDITWFS